MRQKRNETVLLVWIACRTDRLSTRPKRQDHAESSERMRFLFIHCSRGHAITKQRCEIQWEAHKFSDIKNACLLFKLV